MGAMAQAEMRSLANSCLDDALRAGVSLETLAESYLGTAEEFLAYVNGADLTFYQLIEFCRACGHRVNLSSERLDNRALWSPEIDHTPFQSALEQAMNFLAIYGVAIPEDAAEELVRKISGHYFSRLVDLGYSIERKAK